MPELTAAGPALVHFIDFAQLNSVRTLPYLVEWDRRYRDLGLSTIAVQAPRFPFGADPAVVGAGLERLGVPFPVAIDARHELWNVYGCEGWPSLFLWNQGGALAWFQFGEGEYRGTEEAIQAELREIDALRELPEPMAPIRPTDAPGETVIAPTPGAVPGRVLGAALDRRRGRRDARGPLRGRRRPRHRRGRGRDRDRARRRRDRLGGDRSAGSLRPGGAPTSRAAHADPSSRPGLQIWSVSFAAGVPRDATYVNASADAWLRSHSPPASREGVLGDLSDGRILKVPS